MSVTESERQEAIDMILRNDESRLMAAINRCDLNLTYEWSRGEVREIAEKGLSLVHYIQKERREKEAKE